MTSPPAIRVEMLDAGCGDALIITLHTPLPPDRVTGDGPDRVIVIDTGPPTREVRDRLAHRLRQIPLGPDGRRRTDLLVITHIDADHIGNAVDLLTDTDLNWRPDQVWFNGKPQLDALPHRTTQPGLQQATKSVGQADDLTRALTALQIPVNTPWAGGPAMLPRGTHHWRIPWPDTAPNAPQITLLGPGHDDLDTLARHWDRVIADAQRDAVMPDTPRSIRADQRPPIDVDVLRRAPYRDDTSPANRSSIVFLVEHRGRGLLLTGDAHAEGYLRRLTHLRDARNSNPPRIDAIKLSHHGSDRNTPTSIRNLQASHYLVSSDGTRYHHPDDAAIARTIPPNTDATAPPAPAATYWFTAANAITMRWRNLPDPYTISTRYPDATGAMAILDLTPAPDETTVRS